ncbi:MAG TPA: class I SAM-dependent methyltransferase [Allosphingosinicella sp.]|jgi:2-polyprenyl-3-methyl-5-hydroxy-6-metoxy-1,4-benzoquinol methylase
MTGLEHLGRCPVCRSAERKAAYQRVSDGVFGTSGEWDYWSCACGILYLDPRPAPDALLEAYEHYHTHSSSGAPLKWREPGFRGAVRRGYLNARYGYRFPQAARIGGWTWRLRRPAVKNLDFMIRHLPAPSRPGSKVLDVGCGNGDFLLVAQDLGYRAVGIDPDPKAVGLSRSRALDVRSASIPGSGEAPGSFDHVFLNHVVEHLHNPAGALGEAMSLLVPGGRLWLSLPNIRSEGLRRFGRHWRGLEPPRHLALFDAPRLSELLAGLGFERVRLLPPEEAAAFYFRQSQAMACGLDPADETDPPGWEAVRRAAAAANRRARSRPDSAESVTMIAWTRER